MFGRTVYALLNSALDYRCCVRVNMSDLSMLQGDDAEEEEIYTDSSAFLKVRYL